MIHLFHGKNTFISYREARAFVEQARKSDEDREYIEIDGDALEISEVVQAYQTHGMFAVRKLIFIKRLYESKERATITERIIEDFSDDVPDVELVIWEAQKIPANTKYYKFLSSTYGLFEAPELNRRTFLTWAKDECSKEGVKITQKAVEELSQRCNFDPERFANEIKKAVLLDIEELDIEQVQKITTDTYEYDIWKLIDTLNENDRQRSSVILDRLIKQKVDPHYILSMIYRNLRLLVMCTTVLANGGDNRDIARILKVPPFTVPSLIRSSKSSSISELRSLYEKMANLDHQIKIGVIDANLGLTLLSTIL